MALTAFSGIIKALITEDVTVDPTLYTDKSVTHGFQKTVSALTGLTKAASFVQALIATAATIDLEALPGVNGATIVGTGLRVQWAAFENPATNANPITISKGAANGYDGFGADFSLTLPPGASAIICTADAGSNISGANSDLDLLGTAVQPLTCVLVIG